jgi:hypothetical protein
MMKVNTDLVIDGHASEIVIALLENKQLVELNKEKKQCSVFGWGYIS